MTSSILLALLLPACGGGGVVLDEVDHGDCPAYLSCHETAGSTSAILEATYGDDGVCWDEEDASLCRAACTDGLALLTELFGSDCLLEEEVGPIEYSAEIAGFNENLGGDYCTGEFTLTLEEGVLTGEGLCVSESSWVSDTEIWIQADVEDEEPDGMGGITYDAGWGDPVEAEGQLDGEVTEDELDLEFMVEVDFGGWSDTYEYVVTAR
ncbi:MAG: hypothetical protein ACI9VR_003250 [Cognaticolwellia sp.]|jgi:hypothetical protein